MGILGLILQISTNEANLVASGLNRSFASEVEHRNVTFHRMIFFFLMHHFVEISKFAKLGHFNHGS